MILTRSIKASIFTGSLFLFSAISISQPVRVFAAVCKNQTFLGIPSWDRYLTKGDPDCALTEFNFPADIWLVVIAITEILIRLSAYVAVIVIIYAGINMIVSQGNPEKIQGAKQSLEQAIVGLIISVLAVAIITFIGRSIA